jgi:hypothetical protein
MQRCILHNVVQTILCDVDTNVFKMIVYFQLLFDNATQLKSWNSKKTTLPFIHKWKIRATSCGTIQCRYDAELTPFLAAVHNHLHHILHIIHGGTWKIMAMTQATPAMQYIYSRLRSAVTHGPHPVLRCCLTIVPLGLLGRSRTIVLSAVFQLFAFSVEHPSKYYILFTVEPAFSQHIWHFCER